MANSLSLGANAVAGLGTFTYTVPVGAAGLYTFNCQSTVPFQQGTQGTTSTTPTIDSNLQIVLSQSGSATASVTIGGVTTNPTATQPALGTSIRLQCAAGDVLTAALTSTAAVDNNPNAVKSVVNLYQGY